MSIITNNVTTISTTLSTTTVPTTTPTTLNTTTDPYAYIEKSCSEYYENKTGFFIKDYEGIPENLIINIVAFVALLVVFTFLRKIGDYGRFGLIIADEESKLNRRLSLSSQQLLEERYSNAFPKKEEIQNGYGEPSNSINVVNNAVASTSTVNGVENDLVSTHSYDPTLSQRSDSSNTMIDPKDNILSAQPSVSSLKAAHSEEYEEKYIFSWFIHMFTLKYDHIKDKSGNDAHFYLMFQRYLIVYLIVLTALSLSILLPINILNFYIKSEDNTFSKTTITNVDPESPVLWVHLVLSWVFLVFGVVMVKLFAKKMNYDEGEYVSRTILITNYPVKFCEIDIIKKHFAEAYPELVITDIQFAYDIRRLGKLTTKKRSMECGRIQSQKIFEQTNERPTMHVFHFGSVFEICCCFCERCLKDRNKKTTDSIDFYTKNEQDLIVQIAEYKEKVLKNPLGIIFVTFETQEMAAKFMKDYHLGFFGGCLRTHCTDKNRCTGCYMCKNLAKPSSVSDEIKSDMWGVKYATSPSNIIWENVAKYGFIWWVRVFLINIILFIVMFFLTTPSILLEKVTAIGTFTDITKEITKILPDYLKDFLPSLILRILAALLPVLVALTALLELHWTRSSRNRSMMVKTYLLLLFMTLILPTLGLTSINAIFQWLSNENQNIKWRCVSDNGAYFIKYVTTFGLIGTAIDLLRIPDLLLYLLKMSWARSIIERHNVRQQVALEFNYGVEYAWILTMFTVTLSFSVVCPVITPFGLLYMVLKHLIDRYNLYFGYIPSKVDKRIHKTAVTFAIGSFVVLQFCILFFIAVRNKGNINSSSMTTVQTLVVTFSCIMLACRIFYGFVKRMSPFHKHSGSSCQMTHDKDEERNSELDTQESYNKLDHSFDESGSIVETEQPSPVSGEAKVKKRRNFFKRKKVKKYEIFQSPFVPSLLKSFSTEYANIKNKKTVEPTNLNQSENTAVDLSSLVLGEQTIYEQPRAESVLETSQIDLMMNSSNSDSTNSPNDQLATSSQVDLNNISPAVISYKALLTVHSDTGDTDTQRDAHEYDNVQGLRNGAFNQEEHKC